MTYLWTGFCAGAVWLSGAGASYGAEEPYPGEDHASGGLPQFDPTWFPSQIFWLAIAFLVMYFWFSRKTLPEISGVLENRKEHIQSDLDAAEKLTREAEDVQKAYEDGLANARAEAAEILEETEASIRKNQERAFASFQERADKELNAMEVRMNSVRDQMLSRLDEITADAVSDAAMRLCGIEVDSKDCLAAINKVNDKNQAEAA